MNQDNSTPQHFPQTDFDKWKPYILHDPKPAKVEGGWYRKQTLVIPPADAGSLFIDKEFICCQHEPINISPWPPILDYLKDIPDFTPPKPGSPGESGFDVED